MLHWRTEWLDLGSGGVSGRCWRSDEGEEGRHIDLVSKSWPVFFQAMVGEFGLPAGLFTARIEDATELSGQPDVVTTGRSLRFLSC